MSFFPDADLIAFVESMYGASMAQRVSEMFKSDPDSETAFVRNVRRGLTREIMDGIAFAAKVREEFVEDAVQELREDLGRFDLPDAP